MTHGVAPRSRPGDVEGYRAWVREFGARDEADGTDASRLGTLPAEPLLTLVLLPEGAVPSPAAQATLETLLRQSYPHWEAWQQPRSDSGRTDERLHTLGPRPSECCARWFNRVIEAAAGQCIIPVPRDALLSPHALLEVVNAFGDSNGVNLIYTDEDMLDDAGLRMAPRFKPAWDPELMLGRNMVGHFAAFRTDRIREVGGADAELESTQAFLYDLALRITAGPEARPTRHIPRVLCSAPFSGSEARVLDGSTARRIVAAHLARLGNGGAEVVPCERAPAWNRVVWPVPIPLPRVSIIVPTRDQPRMLARCADGVLGRTDYPNLELIIVDNGSTDLDALRVLRHLETDPRVRIVRHNAPFNFSELNNLAARQASGDVLVLLNDDTEVIEDGWLRELVSQALRPEIGIVGARLLYPDGTVQHAGIVLTDGRPHHQCRLCDASDLGPSGELVLTRSVSAVSAACVALRKSVYDEVGGLDEDLAVAFGDVDLCLRIAERGYRVICTPFAELYHHESATRGYEDTPAKRARMARELNVLQARWGPRLRTDRFANPNLLYTWDEAGSWGLPRPAQRRLDIRATRRTITKRLPSVLRRAVHRLRAESTAVVPNPLFSSAWYVAHYPEVGSYRLGLYRHYRRHGAREGRNPNRVFDTLWYLRRYPDVMPSGMDPLDHYLRHGAAEGRDPSPDFSTLGYIATHPELRGSGENPLLHYLRHEGR